MPALFYKCVAHFAAFAVIRDCAPNFFSLIEAQNRPKRSAGFVVIFTPAWKYKKVAEIKAASDSSREFLPSLFSSVKIIPQVLRYTLRRHINDVPHHTPAKLNTMFALPFHAVSFGLLAAGLLGYADFWRWYVGYFGLFTSWMLLGSWAKRPNGIVPDSPPLFLTEDELRLVKRHAIYFTSPFSAFQFAAVISVMQLCAIAGAAFLLFRSQWIAAAILALTYPVGGSLTAFVNPGRLLRYHQARGPLRPEGQALLDVIESIERKHTCALAARSEQNKPQ